MYNTRVTEWTNFSSGVKWAECLLIIATNSIFFCLILESPVGLWRTFKLLRNFIMRITGHYPHICSTIPRYHMALRFCNFPNSSLSSTPGSLDNPESSDKIQTSYVDFTWKFYPDFIQKDRVDVEWPISLPFIWHIYDHYERKRSTL